MPKKRKARSIKRRVPAATARPRSTPSEGVSLGRQAAKSRAAREKILGATLEIIKQGGYTQATAIQIARRTGLTWGAVQHHYGTKAKLEAAVIDLSHERLLQRMGDPALRLGTLPERVARYVERMWEHYQDDALLATVEILLATRGFHGPTPKHWADRYRDAHLATLRDIFRDSRRSNAQLLDVMNFVHCCLTGLTLERLFEPRIEGAPNHLARIKSSILSTLKG